MTRERYRAAAVAALLSLAAGCGRDLPPETDPAVAREALTAALDAWKEGRAPDTLRQRTPPVDFAEPQWDKGGRLTDYQVKKEERSGVSVRFTVRLQVRQKDGTSRERTATYNVDAGKAVVIRPDF